MWRLRPALRPAARLLEKTYSLTGLVFLANAPLGP